MIKFKMASFIVMSVAVTSCQAPSEPAELKDSSSEIQPNAATGNPPAQNGDAAAPVPPPAAGTPAPAPVDTFFAGGADVGTPAMKAAVKSCHEKKMLYDRNTSTCTAFPLANVKCTIESIKANLTEQQVKDLTAYLADPAILQGHLLDQCLDCPDPIGNKYCKGTTDKPPTAKGMRLFFVKATSATLLSPKSWYAYPKQ